MTLQTSDLNLLVLQAMICFSAEIYKLKNYYGHRNHLDSVKNYGRQKMD